MRRPRVEFNVKVSKKLWDKWLRHNPQFVQAGVQADADQTPSAAIMEAMLATILTNDLLRLTKEPLLDTSTSLMLAVGHVVVQEVGVDDTGS